MFLHSLHYMKVRSGWQADQKRVNKLHIGSTIETISIYQLKSFSTQDNVIPAQPRPRGRPPKKPILSLNLQETWGDICRSRNLRG